MKATGVFPRSKAQIAGEMSGGGETFDVTDKSDEGGGGEEADTGDGAQKLDQGVVIGEGLELALDVENTGFEMRDFVGGVRENGVEGFGDAGILELYERTNLWYDEAGAGGDGDPELAEDAAGGVDTGSPIGAQGGTETMESGEGVLVWRLDGDGPDVAVTEGFEDALGVRAVGFVTENVGTNGVRR